MGRTITRGDIAQAIYQKVGLSLNECADLLESVLGEMIDALVLGETVKISNFGRFSLRHKAERIGRNPKTRQEVPITSRRVVTFRASNFLKNGINENLLSDRQV